MVGIRQGKQGGQYNRDVFFTKNGTLLDNVIKLKKIKSSHRIKK